ncbi:MAG: Sir2 family NAD+-dependent deacetylase [Rickettsiales bacterium]|nr:Sir2 family NAD+-dependent deacetylase [Rickettsiales bacterium]
MIKPDIAILTGAGISAESGLITFRDNNGLWCNHRIEDVATPEAFARNPSLVHEFYNARRAQLKTAHPNAAHHALARLAREWEGRVWLITQNVDDLHDRALADAPATLLHMHGELKKIRCVASEEIFEWEDDLDLNTSCACCKQPGRLRPHIVWFGEMPLYMDLIERMLAECELFISIGTSGNVYPAAGFVQQARHHGAKTVELNLEPSNGYSLFEQKIYGKATQIVPAYVDDILSGKIL